MAVLSFQETPPSMCPYLILAGVPQTINVSNSWRAKIIEACEAASSAADNTAFFNDSTDGVSCETKQSFDQICDYLIGKKISYLILIQITIQRMFGIRLRVDHLWHHLEIMYLIHSYCRWQKDCQGQLSVCPIMLLTPSCLLLRQVMLPE